MSRTLEQVLGMLEHHQLVEVGQKLASRIEELEKDCEEKRRSASNYVEALNYYTDFLNCLREAFEEKRSDVVDAIDEFVISDNKTETHINPHSRYAWIYLDELIGSAEQQTKVMFDSFMNTFKITDGKGKVLKDLSEVTYYSEE